MCLALLCRKATGSLKYFHDKYNVKTHNAAHQEYVEQFDEAVQYNEQIRPHVHKVQYTLFLLFARLWCCMCLFVSEQQLCCQVHHVICSMYSQMTRSIILNMHTAHSRSTGLQYIFRL